MLSSANMTQINMQNYDLPDDATDDETKSGDSAGTGSGRIVLWLVVLSMGFLVVPMMLVGGVIQEERVLLEEQLTGLQAELNATPVIDPEVQRLEAELLGLRNDTSTLNSLQTTLAASHIDWTSLMDTLLTYEAQYMEVTGIVQEERRLMISGLADEEAYLMQYVDVLQQSELFSQVILQSITRNPPEIDEDGAPLPEYRLVEFVIQAGLQAQAEDTSP